MFDADVNDKSFLEEVSNRNNFRSESVPLKATSFPVFKVSVDGIMATENVTCFVITSFVIP